MNTENADSTSATDSDMTDEGLDASPLDSPDGGILSDKGDEEQRPDVISAMAVYSGDGQVDDASGGDVAQTLAHTQEDSDAEPDRMPHGPA